MKIQNRLTRRLAHTAIVLGVAALIGPGSAQAAPETAAQYQALLANPARTDADRKDDAKRKPAQFLEFAQVAPGMTVLAVGDGGEVWALGTKPSASLAKRLAEHPHANLHPVIATFDDPVPAGQPQL